MGLVPLEDVQAEVLGRVTPLGAVEVEVPDALGLVTVEDVVAAEPVPPFANSAMDGYAVRAADCAHATAASPVRLAVVGEVAAGQAPERPVGPGQAVRIMTGAPVPEGADGIVIVEDTEAAGDAEVVVKAPAGDHIRPPGGDVEPGQSVVAAGTVLGPAHLGVLASLGRERVGVGRRPVVGVLSTGDELKPPGVPLEVGQIRESNGRMLRAALREAGCSALDLGVAPDDASAIRAAVEGGLQACDALLTSGGVSVGLYDHMRAVLDDVGDMRWFQVAIKPAKPFAYGVAPGGKLVFALPGNPVSSLVSFELFARPALRTMMGDPRPHRPVVRAVARHDLPRRPDGKVHFDRVRVEWGDGRFEVERSGRQVSNVLTALAAANGLARLPDGEGVAAGEELDVLLLGWW